VADQRESCVDTVVQQLLSHLDERDRTFPRMHPGGEQNFRPSGRRASRRVVRDTIAECYESKARAGDRDELIALLRAQIEHGPSVA
jgi:hypothetical protein